MQTCNACSNATQKFATRYFVTWPSALQKFATGAWSKDTRRSVAQEFVMRESLTLKFAAWKGVAQMFAVKKIAAQKLAAWNRATQNL